jgi:hypothetical protein
MLKIDGSIPPLPHTSARHPHEQLLPLQRQNCYYYLGQRFPTFHLCRNLKIICHISRNPPYIYTLKDQTRNRRLLAQGEYPCI